MLDTAGGALRLSPGTQVEPISSGVDIIAAGVSFTPGAELQLAIAGPTPDSLYGQLNVAGQVDLSGVHLKLTGAPTLVGHESFLVVNNDGADPILGEFVELPDAAVIADFLGSGRDAAITYRGGDGNDVEISVINATPLAANDDYRTAEDAPLTVATPGVFG